MGEAPKPAATVLLVRDAERLEVLMVRRSAGMAFGASAWVFPGGKVAPEDMAEDWRGVVNGRFGDLERALRIAAARETFEESGLLLVRRASDGMVPPVEALVSLIGQRAEIEAAPGLLVRRLAEQGLLLDIESLVRFAHWITPDFEPRRYDTHFFLAAAPPEQASSHDGREAVDHGWVTPGEVLEARTRGEARLMFPTRLNLEMLSRAATADDALSQAKVRPVVTVEPKVAETSAGKVLRIPAEAGYGLTEEPLDRVMA